ncbi:hypothetical protein A6E15_17080 [Natrinema saccharevitans]|uniref:Carboxypeptidase regulatory-like domain-containing protein n=1 Tax=Natrinema saccharevitans TaxID=301967 RepID=A0A1S8B0I3_9EURY|nr:hypothetical protein [Natrinema saccharevitans]OLZ42568.1 hypothetical protein A6E15_17080 [Natrinema saccharevitans]
MTALASTTDGRSRAGRALVALVLALVVAGTAVTPVAAAAATAVQDDGGDGGDVTITRADGNVEVDVGGLDGEFDNVTVGLVNPDGSNETAAVSGGTAEVPIENLTAGVDDGASLVGATVRVTADGEAYEDTVDLHDVTFAADAPVWIDGDSELVLPLNGDDTAGLTENDTVTVTAGDTDLEAAVRAGGTQLTIPQSALVDAVDPSPEIDLEVSIADHESTRTLEPALHDTDDGLVLWHPLFETGTDYEVAVEDDGTKYINNSATPADPGEIDLSRLTGASEVDATVSSGDGTLVDDPELPLESFELSATIVDDGSAVAFEQGVDGLSVTNAVVNASANGTYALAGSGTIEDGRLALENATVSANDTLVLWTNAGVGTVELSAAPADPASSSAADESDGGDESTLLESILRIGTFAALLVVPGLIGPAVGYGAFRFREEWTRDRLKITGIIAVGFSLAIALVLLETVGGGLKPDDIALAAFTHHATALVGVVLGTAAAPATYYYVGFPAGRATGSTGGFTIDVTVTDGDRPLDGRTKIGYRRADASDATPKSTTIRDGTGRIGVPTRGNWTLAAKHGQHESEAVEATRRRSSVTLTVPFPATVTVTDREDGEPIPGATVTRRDDGTTQTTDESGAVTLEPDGAGSSTEVEISHEKYDDRTETVAFTQDGDREVALAPRTGRVRLRSRVDGAPVGSTPLRLSPREQVLRERYGTITLRTGDDGVATRDGLLAGQYRAEIAPPAGRDDIFDGGKSILTVREDRSATAEVDATFTWSLSAAQRERIDRLRRRIRQLSDHAGRDTTIPRYYGSVVEAMLEAVERLPEAGHHFAHGETDPDAVADSLLAAAEKSIEAINDAMTTKRNVDLFAACADMPDPGLEWDGRCDLETVIDRLESDLMTQRNALKDRYEDVTDRVETERGSVSEAAPAEEMVRHAWELGSDAGRGEEAIATIYAALLLLEAVEGLFERDALRERLSRTVF